MTRVRHERKPTRRRDGHDGATDKWPESCLNTVQQFAAGPIDWELQYTGETARDCRVRQRQSDAGRRTSGTGVIVPAPFIVRTVPLAGGLASL